MYYIWIPYCMLPLQNMQIYRDRRQNKLPRDRTVFWRNEKLLLMGTRLRILTIACVVMWLMTKYVFCTYAVLTLKNKTVHNSISKRWVYSEIAENSNLRKASYDKTLGKSIKGEECSFIEESEKLGRLFINKKVYWRKLGVPGIVAEMLLGEEDAFLPPAGVVRYCPWGKVSFRVSSYSLQ